jgi:FkbM family methyltransferase
MKRIIRYIIGDYLFFILADIKKRRFPSKKQKEKLKIEDEDFFKRKQFYSTFINRNDLCFDVGANMGNRIAPMLSIKAKIVAIEPQKACIKYLRYKFKKQIEIIAKGLGEHEGFYDFYPSNMNVISSFSSEWINSVKNGRFKDYKWGKAVKIEMTTLDNLIKRFGIPAFIKIDVEGYELEVLKGLSSPIKNISFEYTVPEQLEKVYKCLEQLEKINPNIEFNYSIAESMILVFSRWLSITEMKEYLNTTNFISSGFGDIYVRQCNEN